MADYGRKYTLRFHGPVFTASLEPGFKIEINKFLLKSADECPVYFEGLHVGIAAFAFLRDGAAWVVFDVFPSQEAWWAKSEKDFLKNKLCLSPEYSIVQSTRASGIVNIYLAKFVSFSLSKKKYYAGAGDVEMAPIDDYEAGGSIGNSMAV